MANHRRLELPLMPALPRSLLSSLLVLLRVAQGSSTRLIPSLLRFGIYLLKLRKTLRAVFLVTAAVSFCGLNCGVESDGSAVRYPRRLFFPLITIHGSSGIKSDYRPSSCGLFFYLSSFFFSSSSDFSLFHPNLARISTKTNE